MCGRDVEDAAEGIGEVYSGILGLREGLTSCYKGQWISFAYSVPATWLSSCLLFSIQNPK